MVRYRRCLYYESSLVPHRFTRFGKPGTSRALLKLRSPGEETLECPPVSLWLVGGELRQPAAHRWGEKRKHPDWDKFLHALLDYSFLEVDRRNEQRTRLAAVLWAVAEQKDV